MKADLLGKVALVTGSTQGVGRAIAINLAENGADVVVHGIEPTTEVTKEIEGLGRRSIFERADLLNYREMKQMVDHVHIYDIAPTILYLFNQPIPSNMDGEVLKEIFNSEYVQENPPRLQTEIANDKGSDQTRGDNNLTSADEETIQKQLKDLGYI